jgi:hypothetical protein
MSEDNGDGRRSLARGPSYSGLSAVGTLQTADARSGNDLPQVPAKAAGLTLCEWAAAGGILAEAALREDKCALADIQATTLAVAAAGPPYL